MLFLIIESEVGLLSWVPLLESQRRHQSVQPFCWQGWWVQHFPSISLNRAIQRLWVCWSWLGGKKSNFYFFFYASEYNLCLLLKHKVIVTFYECMENALQLKVSFSACSIAPSCFNSKSYVVAHILVFIV